MRLLCCATGVPPDGLPSEFAAGTAAKAYSATETAARKASSASTAASAACYHYGQFGQCIELHVFMLAMRTLVCLFSFPLTQLGGTAQYHIAHQCVCQCAAMRTAAVFALLKPVGQYQMVQARRTIPYVVVHRFGFFLGLFFAVQIFVLFRFAQPAHRLAAFRASDGCQAQTVDSTFVP